MPKIILTDVATGSSNQINNNFSKIEDALNDSVLYRKNPIGTPNQMESDLDMNSNDILNAGVIKAKRVIADCVQDTDDSLIVGGLKDNELVKWDVDASKFTGTGVYSESDGRITTSINSLDIGIHDLGSGGRNLYITNRVDNRHFDTVLQEVGFSDNANTKAIVRERGSMETYQFGNSSAEVLVSPSWTFTSAGNQTVFGLRLWPEIDMEEVWYAIQDRGKDIYKVKLGSFTANDNATLKLLPSPYDLYGEQQYSARLFTLDGSPCRFRGSSDGVPWYKVRMRQFTPKALATEDYVDSKPQYFTNSLDVPNTYTTYGGNFLKVNSVEDGLEFSNILLNDIENVEVLTPSVGDILTYSEQGVWENTPAVPPLADVLRVSHRTTDTSPLRQTLLVSNSPETVVFNTLEVPSDGRVTIDLPSGELTFTEDFKAILTVSYQVVRETASGDTSWGSFVEFSLDDGMSWLPAEGTTRRITLTSGETSAIQSIDYTTVINVVAGEKIRLRHATDDSSRNVGLISMPESGGLPTSSGVTLGVYLIH